MMTEQQKNTPRELLPQDVLSTVASKNLNDLPWAFYVLSMPDYRYVYVNDAMTNIIQTATEASHVELLGIHPWDVSPKWKDAFLSSFEEAYSSGKIRQYKYLKLEANTRITYWDLTLIPNMDESGEVVSISALVVESTVPRKVTRERQRLATILEATSDFVITADLAGQILFLNKAARDIFGIPESASLLSKTLSTYHPDWAYGITCDEGIPVAVKDGLWSGEGTMVNHNGKEIPVSQVIVAHKAADGSVDYLSMIARDITDRKIAEQRHMELEAHKLDFYRRTILAATEGKLMIGEREEITSLAGEALARWEVNLPEDLAPIRYQIRDLALTTGMEETRIHSFVLVCGEAMTNALKHAGRGCASLHKRSNSLIIIVSDNGPGIEALSLPDVALTPGYSTAGTLGMGYTAMLNFADKVYLATGTSGTTVAVEMKFTPTEHGALRLDLRMDA